ncbi:MAG: SusC/RagA family TonB-linked outer membrane protein [Gemmatimonadetes bacterium]|nr:SusC/RagA family TonB-linked outer membrane protein [Gemmatimonadota bacterium]
MSPPRVLRPLVLAAALVVAAVSPAFAQRATVTGRVVDATNGQPVAAAQVMVVGTNLAAQTNSDGVFTIRGVAPGSLTLRALRLGYTEEDQRVTIAAGQSATANFTLHPAPVTIAPVVTTATGQQRRIEVGNSVANVNAAEITETKAVSDMADLLTSRAAGVLVVPGTQTGAGVRVRIRGLSSLSLSNNPIYVIDGIRVEGTTGSLSLSVGGTTPARINDINPEEIESIEVVRGPSASTLYGTDAANGVIVITTKKGVAGRPQWKYYTEQTAISDRNDYPTAYWGWTKNSRRDNTVQCYLYQVAAGSCAQDSVTAYNLTKDPESTPFGIGYRQQHGLQLRGGTDAVRYFLSGEYENEDGVTKVSEFDKRYLAAHGLSLRPEQENPGGLVRYSARANLSANLPGNFDLDFNTGYTNQNLRLPESDDSNVNGIAGNIYGGAGYKYMTTPAGDTLYGWRQFTPRDVYQRVTTQQIQRLITSAHANWRPQEWLALRGTFGVDYINRTDTQLCRFAECTDLGENRLGFKYDTRTNFYTYTADAAATATRHLRDGLESTTTLGVQYTRSIFDRNGAYGDHLPPGATTVTAASIQTADESTTESRTLGAFLEEHLAINERLYLTGAVRSDRNSAFGADFKTAFYPKFSASWVVSDERFFPKLAWLSQLRLRTAYGASGVQPGTTDAVQYFAATTAAGESGDEPGVVFSTLGNSHLKPERSTEIEFGVDGTFFGDRLSTELTYYDKHSKDALISRVLPPSLGTGATSRFENLGEVRNWGWEGLINAQLLRSTGFGWDITLNGSANSNKLVSLGGVPPIVGSSQQEREGYPLYGWWSPPLKGWEDKNGNGIIEYNPDPAKSEIIVGDTAEFLGYSVPRYEVALSNGFDLFNRRVRLSALIDYKGGFKTYNNTERIRCASRNNCSGLINPKSSFFEQARTIAVRQHPTRTLAGFFEDGSFVRFRELGLTYTVPESFVGRVLHSRSLVAALAVRNLGVLWTKYTGVDPEAFGTTGDAPSEFQAFGPPTYLSLRLTLDF